MMKRKPYVEFIALLIILNILPWALAYLDFPHHFLNRPPLPFDWTRTAVESLLVFITSCFYAVFSGRKIKKLSAQWSFLNDALTGMPEAVFTIDMEGNLIYMNTACSKLVGYKLEDTTGKKAEKIFGKEVESILRETFSSGNLISGIEVEITGPDNEVISCIVTSVILKGSRGEQVGCVAILRDMREEKKLYAKLINMERLASLGQLTASITHELNQPLNVIMMLCTNLLLELELRGLPEKSELEDSLEKLRERAERASKITDQVLSQARELKAGVEEIDINSVVNNCLSLIEPQMRPENIDIKVKLSDDPSPVKIDRGKLEQVLFNIMKNAREAMNASSEKDSNFAKVMEINSLKDGNFAIVSFKDTGGGIPQDIREKVFTPFFTTKEAGTGLGLGICKEIIESFGGELDFEVEDGKGTTFRVKLPKA